MQSNSIHSIDLNHRNDGSAGDVNYGVYGHKYHNYRQPDPRIATYFTTAFKDAKKILNVGAGSGNYEPLDREVVAIEPSASMREQRPSYLSQAIDGSVENIPFVDNYFDASMGSVTIHQWTDLKRGLTELRRVTKGSIVLTTFDPTKLQKYWLYDYAPEVILTEARRFPTIENIRDLLGGVTETVSIKIPLDCVDGFNEAYYGRPEMLLLKDARTCCSAWSFLSEDEITRFEEKLSRDLSNRSWDQKYGHYRMMPEYEGSFTMIINYPNE